MAVTTALAVRRIQALGLDAKAGAGARVTGLMRSDQLREDDAAGGRDNAPAHRPQHGDEA